MGIKETILWRCDLNGCEVSSEQKMGKFPLGWVTMVLSDTISSRELVFCSEGHAALLLLNRIGVVKTHTNDTVFLRGLTGDITCLQQNHRMQLFHAMGPNGLLCGEEAGYAVHALDSRVSCENCKNALRDLGAPFPAPAPT